MSGKAYTGKSADGSDMKEVEGVYDYGNGMWGNTPPPGYGTKRSPIERMIDELAEYLVDNERTIEEEYKLVEQKKSQLSKRMRDFVVIAYAMEQAKETNEGSENREVDVPVTPTVD